MTTLRHAAVALAASLVFASAPAEADVVTDWNEIACAITGTAGAGAPGHRLMAIVQVSVFDAVSAIDGRWKPYMGPLTAPAGASVDAAVAAANLMTLTAIVPNEKATIEAAYKAALAKIPDGAAKSDGSAWASSPRPRVLARAEKDAHAAPDIYQPHTSPGVYVPTMIPVSASWPKRTPWILSRTDQFRPGPPPALDSETWAKDLQEVKLLGREDRFAAHPGPDGHRSILGRDAPAHLPRRRAQRGQDARPLGGRQRAAAGRRLGCRRRRAHRRLRREVHLQLLAAGHRDPQRPHDEGRQGRDRDGRRSSTRRCIPNIRARIAWSPARWARCSRPSWAARPTPKLSTKSPTAKDAVREWDERRCVHGRGADGAHLRRRALSATPRRSAASWAARSERWRWRSSAADHQRQVPSPNSFGDERHRGEQPEPLVRLAAIGLARVLDRRFQLRLGLVHGRQRKGEGRALPDALARKLARATAECIGIERGPGRIVIRRGFVAAPEGRLGGRGGRGRLALDARP
jgi:hypothetical protein